MFGAIPGYPPADHEVRNFLTAGGSQTTVYQRMCAFLEALFEHTTHIITTQFSHCRLDDLASQFREAMTEGQTFRFTNDFRRNFYDDVIEKAEEKFRAAKVPHASFLAFT
jgi:hypothetical protein